jgi:hypothetical protein
MNNKRLQYHMAQFRNTVHRLEPPLQLQRLRRCTRSVASSPSMNPTSWTTQRRRPAKLVLPGHASCTHTATSYPLRFPLPTSMVDSLPQISQDLCSLRQTSISKWNKTYLAWKLLVRLQQTWGGIVLHDASNQSSSMPVSIRSSTFQEGSHSFATVIKFTYSWKNTSCTGLRR